MNFNTIESTYEYRIKNIIRQMVEEDDLNILLQSDEAPELLFKLLHENRKELGKALLEDMLVWMSEDDWIEKVKEN
jgi:hypothetical protein